MFVLGILPHSTAFSDLYKCIMETNFLGLADFDTARQLSLPVDSQVYWMDDTRTMLVRECWVLMLDIIVTKRSVILEGKAGRGKSVLVLYIIFRILFCARSNNWSFSNLPVERDPCVALVFYKDRDGYGHIISLDNVIILNKNEPRPKAYFYFSDNCDIGDAHPGIVLTMAVTSGDDDKLPEFRKRLDGVGGEGGANLFLPSLTLEEMAEVFSADSEVTRSFKFNVVGGNPRKYKFNAFSASPKDEYYDFISGVVCKIFGSEYQPPSDDSSTMTEKQTLCQFAIHLVVTHFIRATQKKMKTDSSLFRENYAIGNDFTVYNERYSSRFLELVAGALSLRYKADIDGQLTTLLGRSGIGSMFEETAHWRLLNSTGCHYCLRVSDRQIVPLPFGDRNVAMFHNVADVRNIPASVYALPSVCNFPILDAILPPCYGLQMTIAKDHKVSTSKLADIVSGMGLAANTELHIIFVVPDIHNFTTPTNLPGVKLYITTPECSTEAVMSNLLPSKKRGMQGYGDEPVTKK